MTSFELLEILNLIYFIYFKIIQYYLLKTIQYDKIQSLHKKLNCAVF